MGICVSWALHPSEQPWLGQSWPFLPISASSLTGASSQFQCSNAALHLLTGGYFGFANSQARGLPRAKAQEGGFLMHTHILRPNLSSVLRIRCASHFNSDSSSNLRTFLRASQSLYKTARVWLVLREHRMLPSALRQILGPFGLVLATLIGNCSPGSRQGPSLSHPY